MRVTCSDLTPECDAELRGRSVDDVLLQYVAHALRCLHRHAHVLLEDVIAAIRDDRPADRGSADRAVPVQASVPQARVVPSSR